VGVAVVAFVVLTALGRAASLPQRRAPALATVAYRVHHEEAMIAFYTEAFGVRFRVVETRGVRSHFGELSNITLKLVPIREAADFKGFPIHQLGFEVPHVARVIDVALRHGGRVQEAPVRDGARVQGAVRDPDGNTIELYGPR
jgi:catechol 2,3-dioxygenase-like lactoylglutathione lyase family enzyme